MMLIQWRVQDFPGFFPKTRMKMEKIGPIGDSPV